MSYTIRLPFFEGPFDLLFHLINRQELDIWSVSIAEITAQYLDFLRTMEELNLEIASEFLVMAATLLRLKSKMLLPSLKKAEREEDGEADLDINSPEELISRILEYRLFKFAAQFLHRREEEQKRIFLRSGGSVRIAHVTGEGTSYHFKGLPEGLAEIMRRLEETSLTRISPGPGFAVIDDYVIKDKINYIISRLKENDKALFFNSLLLYREIEDILFTFIAVLEMARRRQVKVWQESNFGPILIERYF